MDDYLIGTVTGVVMGGPSVQPVRNFPGTVSTEGQIGIPFDQESEVVVQQHDRLLIGSTLYAVVSDRLWTDVNVLTGSQPSYYWVEIRSTT
ncbi:hypothetical protein H5P33_10455 [Mycolicibacterium arabiense]|uniref:hypothetical protein n=1 Tax=Mycolicibacterium arabiense TaxID=1286181 RepID=UPI0013D3D23B|nr:hypothetical protein [Mycolicibacterium arabiense]MCV7373132.1 hypothetical protein [Mycolicibacterium arabiense]